MNLTDVINNSEFFTDENAETVNYLSLANKAIAIINIECNTLFPRLKNTNDTYTYMPKDWFFSLISPYLSYGVKMNDSSLTEAEMYLDEFYRALNNFKDKLGSLVGSYDKDDTSGNSGVSPDLIKDEGFGGVYEIDTSNAINIGFFGNNGNGGCW